MQVCSKQICAPGAIVAVRVGPIKHVGIATDRIVDGMPTVISNSLRRRKVVEEPWADFSGGKPVAVLGNPGRLPAHVVLTRARSRLGHGWAINWNCEHFVRNAHGLNEQSPTLQWLAGTAAAAGLALAFMGARWRQGTA